MIFELALDFIDENSYSLRLEVFTVEGDLLKSDYLNLTTAKAVKVKNWLKPITIGYFRKLYDYQLFY